MYTHPQKDVASGEALKLRKQAGKWLQNLREAAGLSQGDLSKALGMRYYSFVSQVESGRARVPPGQLGQWADALNIPQRQFAITLMSHYDPVNYKIIFEGDDSPTAPGKDSILVDLRISEIEILMSELDMRVAKLEDVKAKLDGLFSR